MSFAEALAYKLMYSTVLYSLGGPGVAPLILKCPLATQNMAFLHVQYSSVYPYYVLL